MRATARLNGVHPETVLKVLHIAGMKAERVLDEKIRNVHACFVQIDEAWGFVFKKDRHVTPADHPDYGDQWAFLAITEHKLITSYALGKRDHKTATEFISSLRERVTGRFQLTSDGWRTYIPIVEDAFGADDYGWEIKDYGTTESGRERYSPGKLRSVQRIAVIGNPTWTYSQLRTLSAAISRSEQRCDDSRAWPPAFPKGGVSRCRARAAYLRL